MKNIKKIYNFINKAKYYNSTVSGEMKLWRAVLCQAAEDAINKSNQKKKKLAKRNAITWFKNEDKELEEVCTFAGVRTKTVKTLSKKFIKSQNQNSSS